MNGSFVKGNVVETKNMIVIEQRMKAKITKTCASPARYCLADFANGADMIRQQQNLRGHWTEKQRMREYFAERNNICEKM